MRPFKSNKTLIETLAKEAKQSIWYERLQSKLNYKSVRGYIDTKTIASELCSYLWATSEYSDATDPEDIAQISTISAAYLIATDLVPIYWLSQDLAKALLHTELPTHWVNLKPFVPSGIILLPPIIKSPDNKTIEWLHFNYFPAGYIYQNLTIGDTTWQNTSKEPIKSPILTWISIFKDFSTYSSTIRLEPDPEGNPEKGEFYLAPTVELSGDNTDILTEKEFTGAIDNLVFQLLLYMMAKPNSISIDRSGIGFSGGKNAKKSKLANTVPKAPLWIGKNYQLKYESSKSLNLSSKHSPRTHWRRGHWRNQPTGSRDNPLYKNIWIEPTIVSG